MQKFRVGAEFAATDAMYFDTLAEARECVSEIEGASVEQFIPDDGTGLNDGHWEVVPPETTPMDARIDALRAAITAIAQSRDEITTEEQCEDLTSLSDQLHILAEASWNRHLAAAEESNA